MKPRMKPVKEEALRLIEQLPDNCLMEDILYQVYLLDGVTKGLEDIEAGRVLPHEEVRRQMQEWFARYKRDLAEANRRDLFLDEQ